jgi:two-component system phosphate regulon sensor histidine kinase PhoR
MEKNIYYAILKIVLFACGLIILFALLLVGTGDVLMQICAIVIVAVFFSALFAWRTARKVAKPVRDTAKLLKKIAVQSGGLEITLDRKDTEQLTVGVNSLGVLLDQTIGKLSDSNNSLTAMLKAIPCAVIAVDRDKKIAIANDMAVNFFSLHEETEGRYFIETVRNSLLEKMIDEVIASGRNIQDETPSWKPEGESIYSINVAPIKNENKVTGAVLLAQDVTEIRQLERMRREFTANVSHELKTPLTVISGFLETIKNEKDLSEGTRDRFLDIISLETERLSRLIGDILSLSEIEADDLSHTENVDIDECIGSSVQLLLEKAKEKHITVESDPGCGRCTVLGTADRISQMAINLIDNAVKYTSDGGKVSVVTRKNADNCIITVEDNGIGISMKDQRRLFERFYRADKSRSRELGGTGLGLSIVKHIVSSMNGSISVKSEPGKGSVFTVKLPLV